MKPRPKSFRVKPKSAHAITVKQCNGGYLAQCSCGEWQERTYDRSLGRRVGEVHIRKVAPHLAGPRV